MLFIQMTGLSGTGKTTLANFVKRELQNNHLKVEVIDGDEYRKHLCKDLGFSKEDRIENIKRLGILGHLLVKHDVIAIMAAINPYHQSREELRSPDSRLVWLDCPLEILRQRDTKGLYRRADLPEGHKDKILDLTGYGDPFEIPQEYDLKINTGDEGVEESAIRLINFIKSELEIVLHNRNLVKNEIYGG